MLAMTMETALLPTDTPARCAAAVTRAAALLAAGEPVALPTETVYGLAADALRPEAVVKIFEAKERPFFDPLIVHLPTAGWLDELTEIPTESRALVEALIAKFWPGPLTLVLPRRAVVPDIVTAGLDTVAVRMSAHPVFRAVLARFARPLAAPSANRFGRISPTTAEHVRTELGGRIPLIVDGGPTEHGLESTIVTVEGGRLRLLRAGPVTAPELAAVWLENHGGPVDVRAAERRAFFSTPTRADGAPPEAPGQLASHYAPGTPMFLGSPSDTVVAARRLGLLAFRAVTCGPQEFDAVEILSPTGDLREAAATLFAKMRRLDEAGLDLIVAEPVPERGLGIAIMDRLRKAAAGHG